MTVFSPAGKDPRWYIRLYIPDPATSFAPPETPLALITSPLDRRIEGGSTDSIPMAESDAYDTSSRVSLGPLTILSTVIIKFPIVITCPISTTVVCSPDLTALPPIQMIAPMVTVGMRTNKRIVWIFNLENIIQSLLFRILDRCLSCHRIRNG